MDLRKGRETIQNDYLSGGPVTMTDGYNIEKVSDLLKSDRRFTYDEIATEVGISKGSVHTIIRDHLEMRKVSAHLTSDQIERRLEIATDQLSRFTEETNDFLSRIVANDEPWVRSFEPELKSQASEWHTPNSLRPAKVRRTQGKIKMLMIFAYDIHGILTSHRAPNGQTVNGKY